MTAHRRLVALTIAQLALPVVAVTIGVIAGIATHWSWLGYVTSAAVATVALLCVIQRSSGVDTMWHQARAISEAVKSLAWRFAMRSAPFHADDEETANREFVDALRMTLERYPNVLASADRAEITQAMHALRRAPADERLAAYVADRLTDQLSWYDARARHARDSRNRCDIAFYVFAVAAVVSGIVVASVSSFAPVTAAASTAAASALAWAGFRHYSTITHIYGRTANELGFLRSLPPDPDDDQAMQKFVDDVEAQIGSEHVQWLAVHG